MDDVLVGHPGTGVSHQQCTPGATMLLAATAVSGRSEAEAVCLAAAKPIPTCAAAEAVDAGGKVEGGGGCDPTAELSRVSTNSMMLVGSRPPLSSSPH
eukprot:7899408-Lingulodinium_polyedra.AAC.1